MDSLSIAISLIRTIHNLDPDLYNYVSRLVCLDISSREDFELLIKDPQCLCTRTLTQIPNTVRNKLMNNLPHIIGNTDIIPLFSVDRIRK